MKQICGYKGLDKKFYETETECLIADKEYKIRKLKERLDDFPSLLQSYMLHQCSSETLYSFHKNEGTIMRLVAELVLLKSDEFIEIINQKKTLEVDLDFLEREVCRFNKPWWLKTIWWKK